MNEVDEVFQLVERIEKEWKDIFATAGKRIIKAQKHQAKGYSRRHGVGTSFFGWHERYLGPYSIVAKCSNGNFKLKDKYSHFMKTEIHPSRLVRF